MRRLFALSAFVLAATAPAAADLVFSIPDAVAEGAPTPVTDNFLVFHQLPVPASRPEERVARLETALAEWAAAAAEDPGPPPALPGYLELALDFSAVYRPEDAITAAHRLSPTPASEPVYEELGVALLAAARAARMGDEPVTALAHLDAARHAFDLADRERQAAGSAPARDATLHRALVRLEETVVSGTEAPWHQAKDLLLRQLEVTPEGATADWALRMLNDPPSYLAEPLADVTAAYYVGGDVRAPVKVFTPRGHYTGAARRGRIQGIVIIQALIDRHGSVAAVRLLKGLPMGLGDEALRTFSTWLFEPATRDGEPVPVFYNLTMSFRL